MSHELVADETPTTASRLWRVVGSVAVTLAVLAAAFYLWPTTLGGCATFTVVTGESMEPTYHTGDVVFSRCGTPAIGDVAVYASAETGGARIIHRVIGGDPVSGWALQGDNNSWVDPFEPTQDDVVGLAKLHVPKLGLMADALANRWMWLGMFALAAALFLWPSREDEEERELELVPVPAQAIVASAVADFDADEVDERVRRYVGAEPELAPEPVEIERELVAQAVAGYDAEDVEQRAHRYVDDFAMEQLDEYIAARLAEPLSEDDETSVLDRPLFDLDAELDDLAAVGSTTSDDWWTEEIERLVFPNGGGV